MNLQPSKDIGRFVISCPSRFSGVFESGDLRIDHFWPNFADRAAFHASIMDTAWSRQYFVISVLQPISNSVAGRPATSSRVYLAEEIAALAAVWYGKAFRFAGALVEHGMFMLPAIEPPQPLFFKSAACFDSKPRRDLGIELNWTNFNFPYALLAIADQSIPLQAFWNACRYYSSGLNYFEQDAEVAFFLMISAIEFIGVACEIPYDDLYPEQLRHDLALIQSQLSDGERIAADLKNRLFQLRSKVGWVSEHFLNDSFFRGSESSVPFGALTRDAIPKVIKEAYDLRSSFAHKGAQFGRLVEPMLQFNNEVLVADTGYMVGGKIVSTINKGSLTFLGLERACRYIILSFCHNHLLKLNERLSTQTAGV